MANILTIICVSVLSSSTFLLVSNAEIMAYRTGHEMSTKTSKTLDFLIVHSAYDRRLRPQLFEEVLNVTINLSIRSMGPVDETKNAFSLDCYFRQSWLDKRLKYNVTGVTELALNWEFLNKIWVPDTYFMNEKKSYLHKVTVPNRFIRISPFGQVSYSQRLTIRARCPMNLSKFPLDKQTCPLRISSFGYDSNEVAYKWKTPSPVSIEELGLAQFHLTKYVYEETVGYLDKNGEIKFANNSIASINFYFERQTGFFLLQIYTPLTLLVFCSWVAFWLVKTEKGGEVPARTALGATSVLSIVNIGFTGKGRPKVGYATALDVYIILCFITVFAALVEFACINYIDTFIYWKKNKESKASKENIQAEKPNKRVKSRIEVYLTRIKSSLFKKTEVLTEFLHRKPLQETRIYKDTTGVIHDIDTYSRKLFPLTFFILQIFYWMAYKFIE